MLAIGPNIHGTGLTRVMKTVLDQLASELDIDWLGIGYKGPVADAAGVRTHPTNPRGGDIFAAFQAREMIERDPPDVVFVLHDLWIFENFARVFEPVRDRTKFVGYVPLDGNIVDETLALPLRSFDRVVVYTEWAAGQVANAFTRLRAAGHGERFPAVSVVPHGVDTAIFKPAPELVASDFDARSRVAVKRRVFPTLEDAQDSFIVLNASRPAIRKRVDTTLEAFALFAEHHANVWLCLHHAIATEDTKNLLALADELGISRRLLYNPLTPQGGALGDEDLAQLYRACDVGINTAMGEGWGLVSFEHAGTGAAQIVPRHSACAELWNEAIAEMVEPVERGVSVFSPLELASVDAAGVARALERLYTDRTRLRALSQAGHRHASRAEFQWTRIADQWRGLFADLFAGQR